MITRLLSLVAVASLSSLLPGQAGRLSGDPEFVEAAAPGSTPGTERWIVQFQKRPFDLQALTDEYHGARDPREIAAFVADAERRALVHQRAFVASIRALDGKIRVQLRRGDEQPPDAVEIGGRGQAGRVGGNGVAGRGLAARTSETHD